MVVAVAVAVVHVAGASGSGSWSSSVSFFGWVRRLGKVKAKRKDFSEGGEAILVQSTCKCMDIVPKHMHIYFVRMYIQLYVQHVHLRSGG